MSQVQHRENRHPQLNSPSNPNLNNHTSPGRNFSSPTSPTSPTSPFSPLSNTLIPRDYLQRSDIPAQSIRNQPHKSGPSPLQSSTIPLASDRRTSPHVPSTAEVQTSPSLASQNHREAIEHHDSGQGIKGPRAVGPSTFTNEAATGPFSPRLITSDQQTRLNSDPSLSPKTSESASSAGKGASYDLLRRGNPPSTPAPARDGAFQVRPTMPSELVRSASGPEPRVVPRTASIDSAISSISAHSHKSSVDSGTPKPADITNLITAAGSPEAVILHLLKEKQQSSSQNAQLWRLVDKQRTMLFGLNKDLERALADKERYRKKLKEQLGLPSPSSTPPHNVRPMTRADSEPSLLDGNSNTIVHDKPTVVPDSLKPTPAPVAHPARSPFESTSAAPSPLHITHKTQQTLGSPLLDKDTDNTSSISRSGGSSSTSEPTFLHSDEDRFMQSPTMHESEPDGNGLLSDPHPPPQPLTMTGRASQTTTDSKLSQPSPGLSSIEKMSPPHRKPPPAPLNLRPTIQSGESLQQAVRTSESLHQSTKQLDDSASDYDDILEVDEIPQYDRGRRKTREEDDREREAIYIREHEARSLSKKKAKSDKGSEKSPLPSSPRAIVSHLPPESLNGRLLSPGSLASVLNPAPSESSSSMNERLKSPVDNDRLRSPAISPPPMSPGLPTSPRPTDRPLGSPLPRMPREAATSPPLSPRPGAIGLPLSPRANKQPIPFPPHTPMSIASPEPDNSESRSEATSAPAMIPIIAPGIEVDASEAPIKLNTRICQDLVSEEYPNLLLPPNAIPSIEVQVSSSRLRPSRHSYIAPRPSEEEPVFTLSVFSRSSGSELWRVEKSVQTLPTLDTEIRKLTNLAFKTPDRSLFSGHSPAKIDARRAALNEYFSALLDTIMDERTALVLCEFLSSDAIEPRDDETSMLKGPDRAKPLATTNSQGKPVKEGYLTKRGKNFGGWKARFFVLRSAELRYYESPGGPHLGNIKLQDAQIGKQSVHHSPSRNDDDAENQYRHAFLILEPKKRDSSSLIQHVLCAESDRERDEWVEALLAYVEAFRTDSRHQRRPSKEDRAHAAQKTRPKKQTKTSNSPESHQLSSLRGISYEDTEAGEAPVKGPPLDLQRERSSPTMGPGYNAFDEPAMSKSIPISRPTNGVKIEDAGAWGNLPASNVKDKEQKKRSIWGFRARSSSDMVMQQAINGSATSLQRQVDYRDNVRAVFGLPLIEAVEFCPPIGVETDLPAVVYRCLEYLRAKDAASEEGIFRLSGSNVVIRALKERFNNEGDVDFLADDTYYDVHAVASLFKQYLRELPTTVLTRELHLDFLRVLGEYPSFWLIPTLD